MYKKLLANYDSFSEFFEGSLELKDKIDGLLLKTAELSEQTIDPEVSEPSFSVVERRP